MKDGQGRQIDYLRISLTDRCNLRCIYCMPEHGVKSIPRESVLTLEEVHKAIECASQLGIKHIRFTGGEPTVRKGLLSLIERTAQTPGIESVALTTNAILLPGMAADLKAAGLSRVNISLDTLDAEQYRFITRLGNLDDALKGIEAALSAGLFPVKLNNDGGIFIRAYADRRYGTLSVIVVAGAAFVNIHAVEGDLCRCAAGGGNAYGVLCRRLRVAL